MARRTLVLEDHVGADPAVGPWLAALADARGRTLEAIADLPASALDATPAGHPNAIGTLLYHVAAIEADWLYEDILGPESGAEWPATLFPFDVRDEAGRLTPVDRLSLDDHLDRLGRVRELLVGHLQGMSPDDFERPRARADYDVSPAWVIHHLLQHEAEHRAQIAAVRSAAEAERA